MHENAKRKIIIHTETEGKKCTKIHWGFCSVVLNLIKHLEESWYHYLGRIYSLEKDSESIMIYSAVT